MKTPPWLIAPLLAATSLAAFAGRAAAGGSFDPTQAFPNPVSAPANPAADSTQAETKLHAAAREKAAEEIERRASNLSSEYQQKFRGSQGPKIIASYQSAAEFFSAATDSAGEKIIIDLSKVADALFSVHSLEKREDVIVRAYGLLLYALGGGEELEYAIRKKLAETGSTKSVKPSSVAGETAVMPIEARELLESIGITVGPPSLKAEHGASAPAAEKSQKQQL